MNCDILGKISLKEDLNSIKHLHEADYYLIICLLSDNELEFINEYIF